MIAEPWRNELHAYIGGIVNEFQWQEGYAAFTVSASQLDKINQYIRNQINHHSKKSCEEEYLSLLRCSRISFDVKYLW